MTTICFKDGYLAADSQITVGNYKTTTSKLYVFPGYGVIGFSGSMSRILKLVEWWSKGCEGEIPDSEDKEDVDGILVNKDGMFCLDEGQGLIQITAPYFAIGSGSAYAIAAMAMGKSAEEAIREAMRHDIYTGGTVDVIECATIFEKEKKPKYKKKDVKRSKKK